MQTPKAFTPPYGPNDEKIVWTIVGTSVERNNSFAFDLGTITSATLHGSASQWDFHELRVTTENEHYVFSSRPWQTVDTDGWQWFVVTLLRRTQSAAPDLKVDTGPMRSDEGLLILGVLMAALSATVAPFTLAAATSWGARLGIGIALAACLAGAAVMVIKGRPVDEAESLVAPDAASDYVVKHFRRRYRS